MRAMKRGVGCHFRQTCVVTVCRSTRDETLNHNGHVEVLENSISGILIDEKQGLVITHASILGPFVNKHTCLDSGNSLPQLSVSVLLEESKVEASQGTMSQHLPSKSYFTEMLNCSADSDIDSKCLHNHPGKLYSIFKSQKFHKALQHLMPVEAGWKFNENDASDVQGSASQEDDSRRSLEALLPRFVIVKLNNWESGCMEWVPVKSAAQCRVGDVTEVIATPFGDLSPQVFMNSYSKGVMCNVSGEDNVLILTDARCITGSEGGALYTCDDNGNRFLLGMIVSSLCWKNNEWIGLALACSLRDILSEAGDALSAMAQRIPVEPHDCNVQIDVTSGCVNHSVVLIRSGSTWGSGVLIDQDIGLLLTCSHVTRWGIRPTVLVKFSCSSKWHTADIIYCTRAGHQFDIAVLQCRERVPQGTKSHRISSRTLTEGVEVRVTGHALFDEDRSLTPSVTSGVISKVTRFSQFPVLIQSTCAVHAGASGGALSDRDGGLLGIVVCNAKDVSSGASFPHINLSVPVQTIWPVIEKFRATNDPEVLKALHIANLHVQKLWNLGLTESGKGTKSLFNSKL